MNLQMNWRICFREGWFKKYTCFLVLVDLWMVYIQPNRALRLLFQIFTTWPGFPQRAQYWFLPILPPGGKMCSGMIAKCKDQLKANSKKVVYAPPGKCVRGWIAMELDARVDDFRTNTSYLRQSVSAHLEKRGRWSKLWTFRKLPLIFGLVQLQCICIYSEFKQSKTFEKGCWRIFYWYNLYQRMGPSVCKL